MNRTIKFRAWDEDTNSMYQNVIVVDNNYVVLEYIIDDNNEIEASLTKYDNSDRMVIPMQFTGLHDKNGKEIYEGDEYDIGICTKVIRPDFFIEDTYELMQLLKDNAVVELTGRNIYESPELLK